MPLDPRILMQNVTPDIMTALNKGIQAGQAIRQAPIIEAMQKQRLEQERQRMAQQAAIAPLQRQLLEAQISQTGQAQKFRERDAQLKRDAAIAEAENKNLFDIRKETRSSIGQEMKGIKSDASSIKANFDKIKNLTAEVQKGNRISVSQALVSLVKLGDPGSIVNESEMKSALNAPNPIAAMSGMLAGKGVSDDITRSIVSKIDPLNPENVKINDLLGTANALVQSNVPALQERFAAERERAQVNLTEQGINSLFDQRTIDNISALSNLKADLSQLTAVESGAQFTSKSGVTFTVK